MELICTMCLYESKKVPAVVMWAGNSLCQYHFMEIYKSQEEAHKNLIKDIQQQRRNDEKMYGVAS